MAADGQTKVFDFREGALHGDILTPYIIVGVVDYILCLSLDSCNDKGIMITSRTSQRHLAKFITDLDLADYIALVCNSIKGTQDLLIFLEAAVSSCESRRPSP